MIGGTGRAKRQSASLKAHMGTGTSSCPPSEFSSVYTLCFFTVPQLTPLFGSPPACELPGTAPPSPVFACACLACPTVLFEMRETVKNIQGGKTEVKVDFGLG